MAVVRVLIAVVGLLLGVLFFSTSGVARFALSDAFADAQLPTIELPGAPVVAICAVLCLLAGAGFISGRLRNRMPMVAGLVAGIAVVLGFLTWAAAGRDLLLPVANQLAGTVFTATPLIFGALCGVVGERSGVVNVAIEGQFPDRRLRGRTDGFDHQVDLGRADRGRVRRRVDGGTCWPCSRSSTWSTRWCSAW